MEAALQNGFLKRNADNIWFVLGAYFFAFYPWALMARVDFISGKLRTCRLTRQLARIYVASFIFPIIYVTVYAEAQRQANDYKEFGAAVAALMFNVFELLRAIMEIVQLNAFVAWCKDAVKCVGVLTDRGSDGFERQGCTNINFLCEEDEVEEKIKVNDMIVDNELGETEVVVFHSWKKYGMR